MCLQTAYQEENEAEEVVASICKKFMLRMAESMKRSCKEGDLVKVNHFRTRGYHPDIAIGSILDGMMTPLCSAAMRGKHRVVARFLEAGANLNWQDENGVTALEFAVARRRYGSELPLDEEGSDWAKPYVCCQQQGAGFFPTDMVTTKHKKSINLILKKKSNFCLVFSLAKQ